MRHLIAVLVSTTALLTSPIALAAGDAANGKNVALAKGCAGCHGVDGNSPAPTWPNIAGQGEKYLVNQLMAFRDNDVNKSGRANAVMYGFAKDLSDQEIADISAYFASQKAKTGEAQPDTSIMACSSIVGATRPVVSPAAWAAMDRPVLAIRPVATHDWLASGLLIPKPS